MNIKSQKDFFSGVLFMVIGIAFAWGATTYKIGDGARMGPGYFPLLLGVLLTILGGVITFKSLVVETEDGDKIGSWAWKPVFFIIASNLAFGLLLGGLPSIKLPAMGLVAAIFALILISAMAGEEFKLKEVLILAVVMAIMSYGTFVLLLRLQIQVWPTFITG
jgi:hypothetical protein